MAEDRLTSAKEQNTDRTWDLTLRPQKLKDYVGQEQVKENLDIVLRAAQSRKEPIDHTLLYGPPGLGKTTLANIIAREMGVAMRVTSGPAIEKHQYCPEDYQHYNHSGYSQKHPLAEARCNSCLLHVLDGNCIRRCSYGGTQAADVGSKRDGKHNGFPVFVIQRQFACYRHT